MTTDQARQMTTAVLIASGLLLFAYNVTVAIIWGTEATISTVLYDLGQRWPMVPFLLGGLLFHVYWPHR